MKFLERLLRRRPRSRSLADDHGTKANRSEAERSALDAGISGKGGGADRRFPKLSDTAGGMPELLTKGSKDGAARMVREPPATVAPEITAPAVNIWDLEDDGAPAPSLRGETSAPRRRQNRNKTRMLGFEPQEAAVVPLFEKGLVEDEAEVAAKSGMVMFPTGWLVVRQGAGRGAAFPLRQGVSQLGRGGDQAVCLDFGDMSISRSNHAAIAYDPATHQFHIGHGGKSNLVRLNGKPLLTTEALVDGDEIQVGETTLLLKVLCTAEFNWSAAQAGGDGHDMAIA